MFDIKEEELISSSLLDKIGDRKKFLRARIYISSAFNVTSQVDLVDILKKKQLWFVDEERRLHNPKYEEDEKPKKEEMTNMVTWQQRAFKKQRNISGGITVVIEIILNFLPKVHPAAHLIALLPGGFTGFLAYATKIKI